MELNKKAISLKDMSDGEYTMIEYELKKTQYGITYIVTCYENSEPDNIIKFWSNNYLTKYLQLFEPSKKFMFNVHHEDQRPFITIPGYTPKVILT